MNPQEAKEYLKQYRDSLERTSQITAHLTDLRAIAENLRNECGQRVALDEAVANLVDAQEKTASELNRLCALRCEILGTIDSVPDERLRGLLRDIYVVGKRIVRVAADRDQSYEHICRLHGAALQAVCSVLDESDR